MKSHRTGRGRVGDGVGAAAAQGGNEVTLWGHVAEWLEEIRQSGRNERFLPGIEVPREVVLQADLPRAIEGAECIVVAVPSQPFREVTRQPGRLRGPDRQCDQGD